MADVGYLKDNLAGLVPQVQALDIIKMVTRGSSILRLSRVELMESDNKTFPVMTDGPGAYWVGEAERVKNGIAEWDFPTITAKKIAVIIPVTKEKESDTTIDVFSEIKDYIAEAFYKAIDAACLFGTNSPFAKSIYSEATSAGNVITRSSKKLDIDVSDTIAKVEAAGYDVDGFVADISFKNALRSLRDANGNALFLPNTTDKFGQTYSTLYAQPIEFNRNSAWDSDKALCIAGEWKYSIVGIREQIQYEVLREASLFNVTMADNKPLSLPENDMIALKATMRLGFLPIRPGAFAVLEPAS